MNHSSLALPSRSTPSSAARRKTFFLVLALLCTVLFGAAQAAKTGIVPLAGEDFGNGNGVDVNSSPTTLDAQTRYFYRIDEKLPVPCTDPSMR